MSKPVAVQLDCGDFVMVHTVDRSARPQEYCKFHGEWRDVAKVYAEVWHSRCRVCDYHRTHGKAKRYAEQSAQHHLLRTGHRTVVQYYGDKPPANAFPEEQRMPTLFDTEPPF